MRFVIFAGGVGTRLWPLSRKKSPKQFEKVLGDKSTLELTVERILPLSSWDDIYLATGSRYTELVKKILPGLLLENIIGEPEMRDVGPAVGLMVSILAKTSPHDPIAIIWSDHIIKNENIFHNCLKTAETLVSQKKANLVFITQKARFPSQNLGWIEYGHKIAKVSDVEIYEFKSLTYRPDLGLAQNFFSSGHHAWNVGYFVTTPVFLLEKYRQFNPDLYSGLKKIQESFATSSFTKVLRQIYPKLEKISFDEAILSKLAPKEALVLAEELGWSDVGAWEALKEALQTSPDQNVVQGKVLVEGSKDSLIYNYTNQMIVSIDLNGLLVVNTKDVLLICHKNSVPKIKKVVESLQGSKNDHLT
ncbi:mannose-1-phosphate guanylyltransferase [Candidatus Gottesmanbacteria bacterium]|nr:mannose-1-phosphate guanylyltransferase [Candidatus Gottesmanbacteria bacterium]